MIYHDNRPFAMIWGISGFGRYFFVGISLWQNVLLQDFPVCIIFVGISLGFCWDFAGSSLKFRWVFWPRFVTYLKLAAASAAILATMRWSYIDKPLQPIQRCFQTPISTIYFGDKSCRNTFCHKQHLVKMFFFFFNGVFGKTFFSTTFCHQEMSLDFCWNFVVIHCTTHGKTNPLTGGIFPEAIHAYPNSQRVWQNGLPHFFTIIATNKKKTFIPAHCKSCRRTLQYATNYISI